jgi:uncharacterized membrane protein
MKIKNYQIRYNTQSTDDSNRWRLVSDGNEILVSNIIIDSNVKTTKDFIEGIGDKYHITCTGQLSVIDGVAHIQVKKPDNAVLRHIIKTITYRLFGTAATICAAYLLGASVKVASLIGASELIFKPIIYFLHERFWYKYIKMK